MMMMPVSKLMCLVTLMKLLTRLSTLSLLMSSSSLMLILMSSCLSAISEFIAIERSIFLSPFHFWMLTSTVGFHFLLSNNEMLRRRGNNDGQMNSFYRPLVSTPLSGNSEWKIPAATSIISKFTPTSFPPLLTSISGKTFTDVDVDLGADDVGESTSSSIMELASSATVSAMPPGPGSCPV